MMTMDFSGVWLANVALSKTDEPVPKVVCLSTGAAAATAATNAPSRLYSWHGLAFKSHCH